jgi:iron complex outermembrane receptor protein
VGAYYYNEEYFRRAGETLNIAAIAPPLPIVSFIPAAVWTIGDTLAVETDTYAVFGEAAYETGPWTFTLGIRYTNDQQKAILNQPDNVGFRIGAGAPVLFVSRLSARPEVDSEAWSPRAIVSYRWSEDVMTYASVSRGFKGGGFNTGLDPNSVQFAAIDPEEMTNYEIGWKSTLAGGRLRLNGAAYYMDYSDLQVLQTINRALQLTGLVNAADARIFGAELEGAMVFTDHLSSTFALGYNDAKFERYPNCDGAIDCDGNSLTRAPLWSGNAGLDYRRPVGGGARFLGNLLVSYTDDHFIDVDNAPASRMKSVTLVDASLGFDFAEGRYAAILWATNLFDEEHTVSYQSSPVQGDVYQPGPPLMYGLRLRARF